MEPKEKPQRTAVFYAVIAASQSPGHLGYAEGINTMKEARNLVVQTMPERRGRIVKTDEDKVLACFPDAIEALKAAIAIQRSAVENRDKKAPLNVRVFIHFGDGQIPEEELQNELTAFVTKALEVAKPGHIYVSTPTYNNAQGLNAVEFKPFQVGENARNHLPYYDVTWHPETDCTPGGVVSVETLRGASGRPSFFVHGATLVTGPNPPCFYCGSGRHKSGRCPSKQLSNSMVGLERLGHFSVDEINRLFSEYLNVAGDELALIPEPAPDDDQSITHLAPWAFYELKRGYQLRFLDIIWNATPKEDWHKARESKREGSPEGGMLWLARDCIRTSRLDEAEDLLKRYGRKNQTDYRTLCGLALIKIEKENYITAADFLIEALNQPTNGLHKTYILLILSRVYQFLGDASKSDERLRDALGIEPFCPEAIFEIAIRYFKGRRETDAVNRLVKLIHVYKEYYSAALIAPEFAKYQELIAPEIEKILEKARAEARLVIAEAERTVSVVKSFVGENDPGVVEVLGDYQEMSSLLERPEALFNYEGIMDMGRRISSNCKEIEHDRSDHALKTIRNLESRSNDIIRNSTQPRKTGSVLQPILERLARLKEGVQSRSPLEPCVAQFEETSREMDEIEASVKRMDASHALFLMWARFSKDIILVFFITGAVGLVLFPGAVSLVAAVAPDISTMQTGEVWGAQKAILLSGGLFALLFAGFRAVMDRYNFRKEG